MFSLMLLSLPAKSYGAGQVLQPIPFSGGVDYTHICSEVSDNRACYAQNVIGNIQGSITKCGGSERFISQAISSHPFTSLYRISVDRGTQTHKALIATTSDRIYKSTGGPANVWTLLRQNLKTKNQTYSYAMVRDKLVMTGDALTDPIWQYNVFTDSFTDLMGNPAVSVTTTTPIKIRAKYVASPAGNYLVAGNVLDVTSEVLGGETTYYGNRLYYSLFAPNTTYFTQSRFIDIRTENGQAITGITEKQGRIEVYVPNAITEITYTILNLKGEGGDIGVNPIVTGFGCIAPRALVNTGYFDIFPSYDGIIMWGGGAKTRINLTDELRPISTLLKGLYEKIIKNGTYNNMHAIYYPKRQWYVLGYEDPDAFPKGKPNSTLFFDLTTGEWWPRTNWIPACFESLDGKDDDGTLLYGDAMDGYVYQADIARRTDDARKEIVLDTMDSTVPWAGGTTSYSLVTEGTGSVKIRLDTYNSYNSSITRESIIAMGEWYDKSVATRDDKLFFRMYVSSQASIYGLRIDLLHGSTIVSFDSYFTSVWVSSSFFVASSGAWASYELQLSSAFPIPARWTDPAIDDVPFANVLTIYGMRFVSSSTTDAFLYIDDVRLVQATDNILKAVYLTKQFNLGSMNEKEFRQSILTREKPNDSSFAVDVFTDFGNFANRKLIEPSIPKEIFVCGYRGMNGVAKLNSADFTIISSTVVVDANDKDYQNGVADNLYLYVFDKVANSIVKLDRKQLGIVISTRGSLGTGTTNFDTVNQMCLVGDDLYVTDALNNRIGRLRKTDLAFVKMFGELGTGTTQFQIPTGITGDLTYLWVADDGNQRLVKLTRSTFGFVLERDLDLNTIGETVLQNDEKYLYAAYNKVSDFRYFQNVVLEKRNKVDLTLIKRVEVFPQGSIAPSTYTLSGDIALLGPYIFIGFTRDLATTGTYFVQKRLKDNFELVSEYSTANLQFSIIGDGNPYEAPIQSQKINLEAKTGTYLQLRYYDEAADNVFSLYNQAFALDTTEYRE